MVDVGDGVDSNDSTLGVEAGSLLASQGYTFASTHTARRPPSSPALKWVTAIHGHEVDEEAAAGKSRGGGAPHKGRPGLRPGSPTSTQTKHSPGRNTDGSEVAKPTRTPPEARQQHCSFPPVTPSHACIEVSYQNGLGTWNNVKTLFQNAKMSIANC